MPVLAEIESEGDPDLFLLEVVCPSGVHAQRAARLW